MKIEALKQTIARHKWTAIILGIRADEEGTRAKERYFSLRDKHGEWDFGISSLNCGTNSIRRSQPVHISASIPSWIGPN